ncbi:hypothetical protein DFH06DRAFT_526610 [Mycena polygramma]|nr:hypothetical protein DFH06DRAFT_526610 [Mycena polygramma]
MLRCPFPPSPSLPPPFFLALSLTSACFFSPFPFPPPPPFPPSIYLALPSSPLSYPALFSDPVLVRASSALAAVRAGTCALVLPLLALSCAAPHRMRCSILPGVRLVLPRWGFVRRIRNMGGSDTKHGRVGCLRIRGIRCSRPGRCRFPRAFEPYLRRCALPSCLSWEARVSSFGFPFVLRGPVWTGNGRYRAIRWHVELSLRRQSTTSSLGISCLWATRGDRILTSLHFLSMLLSARCLAGRDDSLPSSGYSPSFRWWFRASSAGCSPCVLVRLSSAQPLYPALVCLT